MHFLGFFWNSVGKGRLLEHVAHSPSARGGSSGDGFAGLPGDTRVVCGSGQVSHSEIIRGNFTRSTRGALGASGKFLCSWALGDRCLFPKAPGGYVVLVSALRTGGELGGIRKGSPGLG